MLAHGHLVATLDRAVKPDPAAPEFDLRVAGLTALAAVIAAKLNPTPPDIASVMRVMNERVNASITGPDNRLQGQPPLDLSRIDFEALARRFQQSRHKRTDVEVLKAAIRAQRERMRRLNRNRADVAERFEALIESYNAGSRSPEEVFAERVKLSQSLSEERQRHLRERLPEEEQLIVDSLTRPAPDLML